MSDYTSLDIRNFERVTRSFKVGELTVKHIVKVSKDFNGKRFSSFYQYQIDNKGSDKGYMSKVQALNMDFDDHISIESRLKDEKDYDQRQKKNYLTIYRMDAQVAGGVFVKALQWIQNDVGAYPKDMYGNIVASKEFQESVNLRGGSVLTLRPSIISDMDNGSSIQYEAIEISNESMVLGVLTAAEFLLLTANLQSIIRDGYKTAMEMINASLNFLNNALLVRLVKRIEGSSDGRI